MIKIISSERDLSLLVPEKLARKYNLFPIEMNEDLLVIGIEKENIYAIQDLKLVTKKKIVLKEVSKEEVKENIELCYGNIVDENDDYANYLFQDILQKSTQENASDIHIEPFSDLLKIRIRVDGNMKELCNLSIDLYPSLASVIKYKANMDITEKRLPQDGRIDMKIRDSVVDIRISTVPTTYGEKIVLRLLSRDSFLKTKEELGFSQKAVEKIQEIINKKTGRL